MVRASLETLERKAGGGVHPLGCLFVPADAVVFFLFEAAHAVEVQAISERAGLPFERVVMATAIGTSEDWMAPSP